MDKGSGSKKRKLSKPSRTNPAIGTSAEKAAYYEWILRVNETEIKQELINIVSRNSIHVYAIYNNQQYSSH